MADVSLFDIRGLWTPKFAITPDMGTATFGSCFAQHFGHALRDRGCKWIDGEPAPTDLTAENRKKFGFGQFSGRTGNIYTTSLLRQWLDWAKRDQVQPDEYWEKDGRIYDPFRPNIEPDGFASVEEMRKMRDITVSSLNRTLRRTDLFVFTLGLTESWMNKDGGYEYPMCPGTVAGEFDAEKHIFVPQYYDFIMENLLKSIENLRQRNENIKVLLTVSPVPLTATNSGEHVLVATSLSKSILRTVAGAVAANFDYVDYFPSYEIINSPVFKGTFFEPNLRSVNPAGVKLVMENFFHDLGLPDLAMAAPASPSKASQDPEEDLACEEALLAAFEPDDSEGR